MSKDDTKPEEEKKDQVPDHDTGNLGAQPPKGSSLTEDLYKGDRDKQPDDDPDKKPDAETKSAGTQNQPSNATPDKQLEAPNWDKERQQRDQQHAAERRALQDQLDRSQKANEALLDQLKDLAATTKGDGTSNEERQLAEALERAGKLTADSDPEDIAAAIGGLRQGMELLKGQQRTGLSEDDPVLTEALQKVSKRLDTIEGTLQQVAGTTARRNQLETLEALSDTLDDRYGAEFRNDAWNRADTILQEQGFSQENPPDLPAKQLALRTAYAELVTEHAGKPKGDGPPSPKPSVPSDPGTGGAAPVAGRKQGTNDQVFADIERAHGG